MLDETAHIRKCVPVVFLLALWHQRNYPFGVEELVRLDATLQLTPVAFLREPELEEVHERIDFADKPVF